MIIETLKFLQLSQFSLTLCHHLLTAVKLGQQLGVKSNWLNLEHLEMHIYP